MCFVSNRVKPAVWVVCKCFFITVVIVTILFTMVVMRVFITVVIVVVMSAMVVAFMATHAEDVEFDTCWKSETVVTFFFNVEANERNTFLVLAAHHLHDFAKFFHADVAILICVVHSKHHFSHVVIMIFLVRFFFAVVVVIMVVFVRHHHFHHF